MKTSLVLTAALLCAGAAHAQFSPANEQFQKLPLSLQTVDLNNVQVAQMATPAQRAAAKAQRAKGLSALYNRPAGSFYMSLGSTGNMYNIPFLWSPMYFDVVFPNASSGFDKTKWSYEWVKDPRAEKPENEIIESTEKDLKVNSNVVTMYKAPTVVATRGSESQSYQLFSIFQDQKTKQNTQAAGYSCFSFDPAATIESSLSEDGSFIAYLSPKYFSGGTRTADLKDPKSSNPVTYYTGAKDFNGGTTGCWFGHNNQGFNGMAVYVEKPARRYALRGVHIFYSQLAVTEKISLTAQVFKASKSETDSLELGDLLSQGSVTITPETKELGMLDITLGSDEDGTFVEEPLDVNEPIAVVFSGYDDQKIEKFTMYISCDTQDEGYGQHGYMLRTVAGEVTHTFDLNHFFKGVSLGYTAPTIFLDAAYPVLESLDENVQDKLELSTSGESKEVLFFSTTPSENWNEIEGLPGWLKVKTEDQQGAQGYKGQVKVTFTAEALPAGVEGRGHNVTLATAGAQKVIRVFQGKDSGVKGINGDKAVKSVRYYNVAGVESNVPFEGVNIQKVVYTDGTQAVSKIVK